MGTAKFKHDLVSEISVTGGKIFPFTAHSARMSRVCVRNLAKVFWGWMCCDTPYCGGPTRNELCKIGEINGKFPNPSIHIALDWKCNVVSISTRKFSLFVQINAGFVTYAFEREYPSLNDSEANDMGSLIASGAASDKSSFQMTNFRVSDPPILPYTVVSIQWFYHPTTNVVILYWYLWWITSLWKYKYIRCIIPLASIIIYQKLLRYLGWNKLWRKELTYENDGCDIW